MNDNGRGKAGDVVLVTGSSMGLGLETALHLAAHGFKVYATVRDLTCRTEMLEQASRRGVTIHIVQLDITSRPSIDAAVNQILEENGRIYGLVNNAGIGLRGCFEDLAEEEIRQVFEANVFGTMAVTRRVLPSMRAAGRGRIVTISSVGGRISTFALSAYCSTKFAQEGFAEALDLEIKPFGLRSLLVEPGMIKTSRWSTNRGTAAGALNPRSAYHRLFASHEAVADAHVEAAKTQPADVAAAIVRALTEAKPRMRYVVGRPAVAALLMRRHLPERVFERVYFGTLLRRIMDGSSQPVDDAAGVRPRV